MRHNRLHFQYDAAGNMTAAATPLNETILQKYVWDAWNRLAKVTNAAGSQIQKYTYDGIGRRQTRYTNSNDDTNYFYYDAARRMLENWKQVSTGGPVTIYEQWVMSEIGAKLPAVRFRDADGNGTFDETQHYAWDANGNITAMLSTGGSVVERYTYDAYGAPKYWSGSWTSIANPAYSNRILFGGAYYQDNTTGLYYADARYYHPTLGRFISRDPLLTEFPDGPNLYQYCQDDPINGQDPDGLAEHQKNKSKKNWDKHTKPRAGGAERKDSRMKYNPKKGRLPRNRGFVRVPAGGGGAAGVAAAGASAAIITYLAYKNIEVRYQIEIMEGDMELDQENQKALSYYWRTQMSRWTDNFISGQKIISSDNDCCDSNQTSNCISEMKNALQTFASAFAIGVYSSNRGKNNEYWKPHNADEMVGVIIGQGAGWIFEDFDACMKNACQNNPQLGL